MRGLRKLVIALAYLLTVGALSALEIIRHDRPDMIGLASLATGLAAGMGTVMWGNAQEHIAAAKQSESK